MPDELATGLMLTAVGLLTASVLAIAHAVPDHVRTCT